MSEPAPSDATRALVGTAANRSPIPQRETVAIVALTALALLLRLTSLSRGLFTDEAYSLALAQRSFGHMIELFGYEANGTPYSIVLWPLTRLFGEGEALLRAPAVLAGVASVPALWWAARRHTTPAVALIAAALLALNPMAVFYSQDARSYAFVVLSACLACGTLPRALERGARWQAWGGYVAAMTLLGYCEILAVPLLIPAHALLAWRSGPVARRRWLASLGAVLLACVPLLVAATIARSRRDALYWLPKPSRGLVTLTLQEFTGGFSEATAVRWATLLGGAVLVALAAWALRSRARSAARSQLAFAAAWGVLPGVLLMAASFVHPLFWPRYAILALPGLCLLGALAAQQLSLSRRGLLVAAACLVLIGAAALVGDIKQRSALQEDWPPGAAWLRAERAPGQPLILDNALALPPLGYYDHAFAGSDGLLLVQEWHDHALPAGLVGYKDQRGYGDVPDGPPPAAEFARLARQGGGTVWMVVAGVDRDLQGDPRNGAAVGWARAHCQVTVRQSYGVWVMRASSCPRV